MGEEGAVWEKEEGKEKRQEGGRGDVGERGMERKKRERDEKEIKREGFHHAAVFVKGISDVTYVPYHRWFPSVHQSKETGKKQQKCIITSVKVLIHQPRSQATLLQNVSMWGRVWE